MRQYICDHCGAIVDDPAEFEMVKMGPSRVEVDAEHPFEPFWEGDLCKACEWRLSVMRSRAAANAEWRFSLSQNSIEEEYR